MKKTLLYLFLAIAAPAFAVTPTAWIVSPSASGTLTLNGTNYAAHPVQTVPAFLGVQPLVITGSNSPQPSDVALALARQSAMMVLTSSYNAALRSGVTVTSGTLSLTLPADASSQTQFTSLLTLLNTAPMPPSVTITDVHGTPRLVPVGTIYALLGAYGQQVAALWSAYVTAKAAIQASGTATLPNISLSDPTGQ